MRNTQKITRAMKMVAAAKLRRAQETVQQFRSYAELTTAILSEIASGTSPEDHPLLERREPKKSLLVTICSDRGLCGGFNGNLCREVFSHTQKTSPSPGIFIIGRKAADYFHRRPVTIDTRYTGVYEKPDYETASQIARTLADRYASGEIDRIDLAYNEFVSVVSQKPTLKQLLPIVLPEKKGKEAGGTDYEKDFIFEPNRADLLLTLLPKYVEVQVYNALLESIAAEHAARMTAMDNATKNAEEMLGHLTLVYNRARQSAITSELMDIVGGAEALKA